MRIFNESIITDGVMDNTDTLTSDAIWLGHIVNWSLQADWVRSDGALTGAWKVQVSNAPAKPNTIGSKPEPVDGAVWSDLAGATGSVVDATSGNFVVNLADAGYLWARFVYTNATGTGTINVRVNGKGV